MRGPEHFVHRKFLKSLIRKQPQDLLLVIGTGVSAAVAPGIRALCSWRSCIEAVIEAAEQLEVLHPGDVAEFRRKVMKDRDLLVVAHDLIRKMSPRTGDTKPNFFQDCLMEVFDSLEQHIQNPVVLQSILSLMDRGTMVLTTNYDNLLEIFGQQQSKPMESLDLKDKTKVLQWARGHIKYGVLHIHGLYTDPCGMVLDPSGYKDVTQDPEVMEVLQNLYRTKSFLFVGCGETLRDQIFQALFLYSVPNKVDLEHYMVVLKENEDHFFKHQADMLLHGIKVVSYGDCFDLFPGYVQDLATQICKQRSPAAEMRHNDKIMCLLHDRERRDKKQLCCAINDFQQRFQKPETRREFDLSDPLALKKDLPARVSDSDPRNSISGMQKFIGEDLNFHWRKKFQQEQNREWYLQQYREWERARADHKLAEDLYTQTRLKFDEKARELQKLENFTRKELCAATKEFNKNQAMELAERKRQEKQQEQEDNMTEISNLLHSDLLTESSQQATSSFGPHQVVLYRWKGMSPEQLEEIRYTQKQQIQEKLRLQEEERQRNMDWDRRRIQKARANLLHERQQQRLHRELRKALDCSNLNLARKQYSQKSQHSGLNPEHEAFSSSGSYNMDPGNSDFFKASVCISCCNKSNLTSRPCWLGRTPCPLLLAQPPFHHVASILESRPLVQLETLY
ncbi:Protein FAM118A [Cricetulus griseus]|uniref:Protein FAM118A n=1 Tax=Cricetulus griseus TaxID=10029 RepID=G3IGR0_CRIGR|nr:Protein FAM118A [Cricetulus griseus]